MDRVLGRSRAQRPASDLAPGLWRREGIATANSRQQSQARGGGDRKQHPLRPGHPYPGGRIT